MALFDPRAVGHLGHCYPGATDEVTGGYEVNDEHGAEDYFANGSFVKSSSKQQVVHDG